MLENESGIATFGRSAAGRLAGLRSGIVGLGFIGQVHARAVRAAGGRLVAVASGEPDRVDEQARAVGADRGELTAERLIDSSDVDVVHICTPNHLHAPLAERAIAAGKHVVCEKPLATTVEDAVRLDALAREAGVVAAVPFVYRYYPTVREIRERLRAGHGEQVHVLHGSYLQDWMSSASDQNWRADPALGGASRTFADIGVHWCDLVEFATGHRIVSLVARATTAIPERIGASGVEPVLTEDAATLVFETDRGAIGSLVVSQVSQGRKNRLWFSVDGSEHSYEFDQEHPDDLWIGGRETTQLVRRAAGTTSPDARRLEVLPSGHPQGYQDCFDALVADVYAAAAGTVPDGLPSFADGLRAARLTASVLESARTRSWVRVDADDRSRVGAGENARS